MLGPGSRKNTFLRLPGLDWLRRGWGGSHRGSDFCLIWSRVFLPLGRCCLLMVMIAQTEFLSWLGCGGFDFAVLVLIGHHGGSRGIRWWYFWWWWEWTPCFQQGGRRSNCWGDNFIAAGVETCDMSHWEICNFHSCILLCRFSRVVIPWTVWTSMLSSI